MAYNTPVDISIRLNVEGADGALAKMGLLDKSVKQLTADQLMAAKVMVQTLPMSGAYAMGQHPATPYGTQTSFPINQLPYSKLIPGVNMAQLMTVDQRRLDEIGKDFDKKYGRALEKALVGGTAETFLKSRQQYYAGMIISQVGYQMQAAAAIIAGGVGLATKAFVDFDMAMKNTQSVVQGTEEEMKNLGDMAINISEKTRYSSSEVADAMYFLGSAGYDAKEIMQSIIPVAKLAQGTNSKLSETTEFLATTMAAFNMEASQTGEIANVMAASIAHSQTTMEKLRISMAYIGPIAAEAGISLKEVVAALSAAADVGLQGSKMGTNLRRVIQQLLNPTEQAAATLQKLGLTFSDIMPGPANRLIDIFEKLRQASMSTQDAFKLFGIRGAALGVVLTRLGSTGFQKYLDMLNDTAALEKIVAIQTESLGIQFRILWNHIINLGKAIGENLKPAMEIFITIAESLVDRLSNFNINASNTTKTVTGLTVAFGILFLLITGKVMTMLGWMTSGLFEVGSAVKVLLMALRMTGITFLGAVAAGAALSAVLVGIGYVVMGVVKRTHELNTAQTNLDKRILQLSTDYEKLANTTNKTAAEEMQYESVKKRLLIIFPEMIKYIDDETKVKTKLAQITQDIANMTQRELELRAIMAKADIPQLDARIKIEERSLQLLNNRMAALKESMALSGGMFEYVDKANAKELGAMAKEALNREALLKGLKDEKEQKQLLVSMSQSLGDSYSKNKAHIDNITESMKNLGNISQEDETRWEKLTDTINVFVEKGKAVDDFMGSKSPSLKTVQIKKEYDNILSQLNLMEAKLKGMSGTEETFNNLRMQLLEAYNARVKEVNQNSLFDFTLTHTEIANSFADTIYDMVKGIRTWEDVWQSALDQSLKYFIQGFANQIMSAWGGMIAQMVNSGIGFLGGGNGNIWSTIFQALGLVSNVTTGNYMGTFGSLGLTGSMGSQGFGYNLKPFARGGIVNSPTPAMLGESGPEAVIPLDQYNNRNQTLTIVNVVDPSFVPSAISKNPDTVINVITGDIMNSGTTRKVIRRYAQ